MKGGEGNQFHCRHFFGLRTVGKEEKSYAFLSHGNFPLQFKQQIHLYKTVHFTVFFFSFCIVIRWHMLDSMEKHTIICLSLFINASDPFFGLETSRLAMS